MSSTTGRKDFTEKAAEKMTPDSSKSTLDQSKESITGTADKVARDAVPDSQKSTSQEVGDKASRAKDHNEDHPSVMDKTKAVLGMDTKH